ncbi:uncharacterized protein LOC116928230 [Daphnia magna]|uniref:uncharacterized protein LOC116928230 n=1 Tax=Daphnia magna TaxID=35525 RepID=UPI001E1BA849|nr:uncharacterized protein LOC116928230 [Daphnia magna]
MVQESGSKSQLNVNTAVSRKDTGYVSDPAAGRSYSQVGTKQQYGSSSRYSSSQKMDSQKYGAWGPVYKNKDNFASMHLF